VASKSTQKAILYYTNIHEIATSPRAHPSFLMCSTLAIVLTHEQKCS
jgi:hypothetical protein